MIPFNLKMRLKLIQLHIQHKGLLSWVTLRYLLIRVPLSLCGYVFHQFFFILDEIFFSQYRHIDVSRSMFILGPPRCGTTHFLDLLNLNDNITSMKMWELSVAPSISEKLFWLQVGKLDRKLGSPLANFYNKLSDKLLGDFKKIHETGLFHYEEDAMIFAHSGNSPFMLFSYPFKELVDYFVDFDNYVSTEEKQQTMAFYKRCIQKHLFVFGRDKIYLSKNPFFSTYSRTLKENFPIGKFVYLTRNPYNVVPSMLTLATYFKHYRDYVSDEFVRDMVISILQKEYAYPTEVLDFENDRNNKLILFQDLISNQKAIMEETLAQFGLECSDELQRTLVKEEEKHKTYVSKNKYTLDQYQISKDQIRQYFDDIFVKYGYDEA